MAFEVLVRYGGCFFTAMLLAQSEKCQGSGGRATSSDSGRYMSPIGSRLRGENLHSSAFICGFGLVHSMGSPSDGKDYVSCQDAKIAKGTHVRPPAYSLQSPRLSLFPWRSCRFGDRLSLEMLVGLGTKAGIHASRKDATGPLLWPRPGSACGTGLRTAPAVQDIQHR